MTSAFAVSSQRPAARVGALALLLVGAALVVVGILQTTTSRLTSVDCPSGTELVAKFEFQGGSYVFEKPAGNENVVTISNASALGGDADSTIPIIAVVIKGGNDSKTVWYETAQTSLHFSNEGLPPVGNDKNTPDISNVQFCRSLTPPPETTPTQPETTPVTRPETTPVTQPETTPATQPETTPPNKPETTPPTSPQTTPPATTQPAASTTTTSVEQEPVVVSTSTTIVSASTTSLPHTGAPSAALIALGAVLMVFGGSLMVIGRARGRRANS